MRLARLIILAAFLSMPLVVEAAAAAEPAEPEQVQSDISTREISI